MSSTSINQSIQKYENKIYEYRSEIKSLQQRIEELYKLKSEFRCIQDGLDEFQLKKRKQSESLANKSSTVKFAKTQATIMADILSSAQAENAEYGMQDGINKIETEIQNTELKIQTLQNSINSYQNKISDLYYELSKIDE